MRVEHRWRGLLTGLVLAGLLGPGRGSAAGRFQIYSLKVRGAVQDLVVVDVDQDGREDLVAICRAGKAPAYERFLRIFWQNAEGGFASEQATELDLNPAAIQVDFGQVDGRPGLELVVITGRGVFHYPNHGREFGAWTELISGPGLLAEPQPEFLHYSDFMTDWNGDGEEELLLYRFSHAVLYRRGNGSEFREAQVLHLPVEIDLGPMNPIRYIRAHPGTRVAYWLPQVDVLDFNADGRPDLIATNSDQAAVFLQDEQGRFPEHPSAAFFFNLLQEEERDFRRDRQGQGMNILNVADLDGDGRADLLANVQEGNLASRKSTVRIYWGRTGAWKSGKPDQVLALDKAAVGPLLRDVDGDGDQDLVMLIFDIGVYTAAKVLLTGTFNLIWQYYLLGPDHSYPARPNFVETTPVRVDINKFRLIGGMPNVFADFNGDGKDDLVYGKSDNELVVALKEGPGRRLGVEEVVAVPVGMIPVAADLDHDGKSEVILWYPWEKPRYNLITVLVNRGQWP